MTLIDTDPPDDRADLLTDLTELAGSAGSAGLPADPRTAADRPPRSRLRPADLVDEAILGIGTRPARLILTMIGTVVGIAALLGTLGLGQTASGQIADRFDRVAATRVVISAAPAPPGTPDDADGTAALPWDAADRIARLAGVDGAGTWSEVDLGDAVVTGVELNDPSGQARFDVPVVAASAGLLGAESGVLAGGRFMDDGHDRRADDVVVLGSRAAARLGINRVDVRPSIFIGGRPFAVIGIIASVERRPELLDSVIIPNGTAATRFGLTAPEKVDVRTALGAAQQVARQAATAVAPNDPSTVDVAGPPAPGGLGTAVRTDVNGLLLAFGGLAVAVGGLGIANVTLLSVLERTGEIGLRRALGARRRHIAGQFMVESVVIGAVGGLIGTALGIGVVVGVSWIREWTPVLDVRLAVVAPLIGALVGLLAGVYPAAKAASIEPMTALRAGS